MKISAPGSRHVHSTQMSVKDLRKSVFTFIQMQHDLSSVLQMDLTVTQLLVDPLAYLWYVPLWEVQRFSQRQASRVLGNRHFTVSAAQIIEKWKVWCLYLQDKHSAVVLVALLWYFLCRTAGGDKTPLSPLRCSPQHIRIYPNAADYVRRQKRPCSV